MQYENISESISDVVRQTQTKFGMNIQTFVATEQTD